MGKVQMKPASKTPLPWNHTGHAQFFQQQIVKICLKCPLSRKPI